MHIATVCINMYNYLGVKETSQMDTGSSSYQSNNTSSTVEGKYVSYYICACSYLSIAIAI